MMNSMSSQILKRSYLPLPFKRSTYASRSALLEGEDILILYICVVCVKIFYCCKFKVKKTHANNRRKTFKSHYINILVGFLNFFNINQNASEINKKMFHCKRPVVKEIVTSIYYPILNVAVTF